MTNKHPIQVDKLLYLYTLYQKIPDPRSPSVRGIQLLANRFLEDQTLPQAVNVIDNNPPSTTILSACCTTGTAIGDGGTTGEGVGEVLSSFGASFTSSLQNFSSYNTPDGTLCPPSLVLRLW